MAEGLTGDRLNGYRIAVLEIAMGMCLADHIGDAWGEVLSCCRACGLRMPEDDGGEFHRDAIGEMLREEVEHG